MISKPFILKDIVPATTKELSALAEGELGIFLIDGADNAWKPAGTVATGTHAAFGIGQGAGKNPLLSPLIQKDLSRYGLKVSPYAAETAGTATIVAGVAGYTVHAEDYIIVKLKGFSTDDSDFNTGSEMFTIVGKGTAATIHTAIAAVINEKSERYTAVTTGADGVTNVIITAKKMADFDVTITWGRSPLVAATTTAPTFAVTLAAPTHGIGIPRTIKEEVEEADIHFGRVMTRERYEGAIPTQNVSGTKYTRVAFTYRENKPTFDTVHTSYQENTLVFYCDVTAGSPTTLVADLEEWIGVFWGGVVVEVI